MVVHQVSFVPTILQKISRNRLRQWRGLLVAYPSDLLGNSLGRTFHGLYFLTNIKEQI